MSEMVHYRAATINRLKSINRSIIKLIERLIEIASLQCISLINQESSLQKVETIHIQWKYNFIGGETVSNFQASE